MATEKKEKTPLKNLSTRQKMILGALGALTPSLINLYAVDLVTLFKDTETLTWPYIAGYSVRVLILILYGSLIAFFHKEENSPVKLFQLGAAAPALITIMLGMGKADAKPNLDFTKQPPAKPMVAASIFSPLNAKKVAGKSDVNWRDIQGSNDVEVEEEGEEKVVNIKAKEFAPPQASLLLQFWKGFIGRKIEQNVYAVTLQNDIDWIAAEQAYFDFLELHPDFEVEVFESYKENGEYVVVLGTNLSERAAQQLKLEAEMQGIGTAQIVNLKDKKVLEGLE